MLHNGVLDQSGEQLFDSRVTRATAPKLSGLSAGSSSSTVRPSLRQALRLAVRRVDSAAWRRHPLGEEQPVP